MSASRVTSHDPFAGHLGVPAERLQPARSLGLEAPEEAALSFPASESSYTELRDSSVEAARRMRPGWSRATAWRSCCARRASRTWPMGSLRCGWARSASPSTPGTRPTSSYVLGHSSPRLLLTEPSFGELLESAGLPDGCRRWSSARRPSSPGPVLACPRRRWRSSSRRSGGTIPPSSSTSGTTANPKGCLHTHASLLAEGENCSGRIGLEAGERFWTPLAIYVGGWQVLMSALTRGACASHRLLRAGTALDQLEREHCAFRRSS